MSPKTTRPYPPGEQEKAEYYDGLRNQPRLIARTSATPFVPNSTRDTYHFDKHYKKREPLTCHDIITKYSQAFAVDIISTLGDYPWHRFYPIRINDEMDIRRPVVFVIETLTDSEPWETSIEVALSCRNVIRLIGITDIEVEIQQVTQVPFANKELDAFIDIASKAAASTPSMVGEKANQLLLQEAVENVLPFSSHIGYEIHNIKSDKSGTMGLHLRLGDEGAHYGLTCRHVVLEGPSNPSVDINVDISGDKTTLVRQLTQRTAVSLVNDGVGLEDYCRKMYRDLTKKIYEWDKGYSTTEETAEARKSRCPTSEERERLPRLGSLLSQVTEAASLILPMLHESRIIGHVAYAPSYAKSSRGLLLDWSLVKLDTANDFAAQRTNKVYIGHEEAERRDRQVFVKDAKGRRQSLFRESSKLSDHISDDGFLQITGVVPTPKDGNAARLPVGIRSMRSGLNFGMTNEILAVRRDSTGGKLVVWEWIVFCERNYTCFSAEGDSGTAVWDHSGRFVGMVTGGTAISETSWHNDSPVVKNDTETPEASASASFRVDAGRDLTFVTTAEYLFESIKEFTGQTPHIL
ncbi:hypothetical protein Trihar35433_9665 [Trichoderma harzianum]|nr:hypothetical protein Trihar35433_9665 [Trichoderma harzianum]